MWEMVVRNIVIVTQHMAPFVFVLDTNNTGRNDCHFITEELTLILLFVISCYISCNKRRP